MKILMIRGNPRKSGVCEKLANLFAVGLKEGGADLCDVDLGALNISPCRGCFACSAGDEGICSINDDMTQLREKLSEADALVCVSPVYFYSMSAQMKIFFDRCFPFVRGYSFNKEKMCVENETNFKVKHKKFVTISVASGRLNGSFEAMSHTYSVIAAAMGFDYVADIRRSESPYFGILGDRAVRVRKILESYKQAGREFAASAKIASDVIANAELQLTESDETFAFNSKIFWQLHRSKAIASSFSDEIRFDIRILLNEMCRRFNPEFAPKSALIKFVFTDKNLTRSIEIKDGKCLLLDECGTPNLTITTDSKTWFSMMSRRADVMQLLADSKIVLEGDKSLFVGMKNFFKMEK